MKPDDCSSPVKLPDHFIVCVADAGGGDAQIDASVLHFHGQDAASLVVGSETESII
jgi:hypothetical protein